MSLTLAADSATVDSAGGTLTWTAATQPWQSGDLLLRLRSATATIASSITAKLRHERSCRKQATLNV